MICERDLNLPMIELNYFDPSNMGHRVSILTFSLLELSSIFPKKQLVANLSGCVLPN